MKKTLLIFTWVGGWIVVAALASQELTNRAPESPISSRTNQIWQSGRPTNAIPAASNEVRTNYLPATLPAPITSTNVPKVNVPME